MISIIRLVADICRRIELIIYQVFRNVKEYGARGDGVTDDTAAINRAISDGNRCGANCRSSTVKGALVYFPSGNDPRIEPLRLC
jgi:polygalacturonase